ncbi:hypothetical protein FJTKL_11547 [Diaporthe vaccinii]|uniref:Uncharacterized protein n=1 Tax=Diaporthe vaccinii TaxID=105482 RepID=A0ABR4EFW0_9PEZI
MALARGGPDNFLPPSRHSLAAEPSSWLTRSSGSSAGGPILDRHPTLPENCSPTVNHHAQHTTPNVPTTAPLHSPLTCDCEVRSFAPIIAAAHRPCPRTSAQQEHERRKKKPCLSSVSPPVAPRPRPSFVQPPCGPPPPALWSQPALASAPPRVCGPSTTRSRLRSSATDTRRNSTASRMFSSSR